MRTRYTAIGIALCLIAMLSAATALEYRAGDIIYGGGGSIVNHVGLLVIGPDGDLVVHEAQITDGILLTSIEDFTARPYSSIIVIQVDGVSDEEAAQAAANAMKSIPPAAIIKTVQRSLDRIRHDRRAPPAKRCIGDRRSRARDNCS